MIISIESNETCMSVDTASDLADALRRAVVRKHSSHIVRPVAVLRFNDETTASHLAILHRTKRNSESGALASVRQEISCFG